MGVLPIARSTNFIILVSDLETKRTGERMTKEFALVGTDEEIQTAQEILWEIVHHPERFNDRKDNPNLQIVKRLSESNIRILEV